MFVGAAEDDARSLDPLTTKAKMDLAAIAGLGTIRMTVIWSPGETAVGGDDLVALQNASTAAQFDGIRLIVSIYPRDRRTTPLNSRARGEFAQFAASIARTFPGISDYIVGNEPNLNLFWMPQFSPNGRDLAAPAYELLLAKTYDALKSVSPDINVIGGALSPRGQDKRSAARQTHSPTAFIADLGAAYRQTKRTRPIMDMFAIHPYLIPSRLPPTFAHPNTTTIGIADYPKLVALLTKAFAKTGQPGATLPIVYDEFGYQSVVPTAKRRFYSHLGTPAAADAITEPRQALYYRQAIALAGCQPTVAGMLIFHVVDERDANAWQSGVYYADGTPKTSMDGVRQSTLAARDGTAGDCAKEKTVDPFESVAFHMPPPAPAPLQIELGCTGGCIYTARVTDLADGQDVAHAEGEGSGPIDISLPSETIPPGLYQYALRVSAVGKPGTAVTRFSEPFTIEAAPPPPPPPPDPTVDPPVPPPEPAPAPPPPLALLPLTASLPTL
ncbi:MAG: hypothetical protein QOD85_2678, partial [Gaiellaceae bacterium]|nr:hypothetical protein [Gaiellaceae bacterium]